MHERKTETGDTTLEAYDVITLLYAWRRSIAADFTVLLIVRYPALPGFVSKFKAHNVLAFFALTIFKF